MIGTICMFHAIIVQVLSKNSHTPSGVGNTNHNVFLRCVFCQHGRLIFVNCLTRSCAVKYFNINNYVTERPLLDVMKSGGRVSSVIASRPILAGNVACGTNLGTLVTQQL